MDDHTTTAEQAHPTLLASMLAALRGRDQGLRREELWPAWRDATGMSRSTFNMLLNGTYSSSTAKDAYKTIAAEAAAHGQAPRLPRIGQVGRIPRLTSQLILQMRAAAAFGASPEDLALQHRTSLQIARHIVQGTYPTKAMKEALAMEEGASATPQ